MQPNPELCRGDAGPLETAHGPSRLRTPLWARKARASNTVLIRLRETAANVKDQRAWARGHRKSGTNPDAIQYRMHLHP